MGTEKKQRGRPKKQQEDIAFIGFTQSSVQDEYFRMPAIWIDVCAAIDNLAELKIIQYVLRHTWGYREYEQTKHITVDEFMHGRKRTDGTRMDSGTGLSESAVKDGLARALKHEFLVCYVDDSDKARIKKYYGLKMQNEEVDSHEDDIQRDLIKPSEGFKKPLNEVYQTPRSKNELKNQPIEQTMIRTAHTPEIFAENIRYLPTHDQKTKVPAFIKNMIDDFSRDMGDPDHIGSNISQSSKLYHQSGLSEEAFIQALYEARDLAKKATQVKHLNSHGNPNRMPYFFKCLAGTARHREVV
jgi:hypothetical protein